MVVFLSELSYNRISVYTQAKVIPSLPIVLQLTNYYIGFRGRCGCDRMVVGFTTTCAIMTRCTRYNIM